MFFLFFFRGSLFSFSLLLMDKIFLVFLQFRGGNLDNYRFRISAITLKFRKWHVINLSLLHVLQNLFLFYALHTRFFLALEQERIHELKINDGICGKNLEFWLVRITIIFVIRKKRRLFLLF